jgi:signal transduction histidine kinase
MIYGALYCSGGNITSATSLRSELEQQIRKSAWLHGTGAMMFLASMILICALLYKESDQTNWVNHTYEVRFVVNEVLFKVKSAESASRGYVATQDQSYLTQLAPFKHSLLSSITELKNLTSDNPRQQKSVEQLLPEVNAKIDFSLNQLVAPVKSGQLTTARQNLLSNTGERLMDTVQNTCDQMLAEEARLLEERHKDVQYLQESVFIAAAGLSALALATLYLSFKSSRQFLKRQGELVGQARQAEAAQLKIAQQLERSNKDLQQFAYVASHDLQEPLRAVGGFLSLLSERCSGQLGEQADRWIIQAVDGAERMRLLINDLLAFARVDTRGAAMTSIDCSVPVREALDNLSVLIDESGAQIEVGGLPHIVVDRSQLTQVFQNLIGNSIKYKSDRVPHITIDAEQKGKEWQFSIKDNGIGFDPAHAERIFVIFQRLYTRAEYAGTGIGLALCSRIIERHGGRIWAISEVGTGSTFFFTLPIQPKTEETNEIN